MKPVTTDSRTTLDALCARAARCTLCAGDLPAGPRPIFVAEENARILIASQAPGRIAHESGVPFRDPSGERLRDWLGLEAERFYDPSLVAILPMGFCYPGSGRSGDLPPLATCAATWRQAFLGELRNLELTLVIGRHAQRWHLPGDGRTLTEIVRAWRELPESILALPHPSPRNNVWLAANSWFERELLPVLRARVHSALAGT